MRLLAMNCGSSSIKAAVFAGTSLERVLEARAEWIGTASATLRIGQRKFSLPEDCELESAATQLLEKLADRREAFTAIAHRIVHGGTQFTRPTLLDAQVLEELDRLSSLAPLHNPPALAVIRRTRDAFIAVPQYGVFDTSFHATLPPHAFEYALPRAVRIEHGIRRYGFHGISHSDVAQRVASRLGVATQALRIISCHLGSGASATAIEHGVSVETSMGMTPLEGLVMGTRGGDMDPGVVMALLRTHDRESLQRVLSHESGLIGLTGTNDMRGIEERAHAGDEECRLALSIYSHRVRKYIGAYAATMGGVDAIAFTGGVGENSALIRHHCLQRLDFLGVQLDEDRNRAALIPPESDCDELSQHGSRVRLFAVRANEERAMAAEVLPMLLDARVKH